MHTILLIAALICAGIATILGFQWFGTDGADWPGWAGATLFLFILAHLVSDLGVPGLRIRRGE